MPPMVVDMPIPDDDSEFEPAPREAPAALPTGRTGWNGARMSDLAVWVELGLFTLAPAFGFLLCWWGL